LAQPGYVICEIETVFMLQKEDVRKSIATLLRQHMDIDPALALQDVVFSGGRQLS